MPRSECALYLSGDDNGFVEGLPVAVHPLDILLQAFAVVEHLPPLLGVTHHHLITHTVLIAAVVIAAGGCFAAVCLGCTSSALRGRLGSLESDGSSVVEKGQLTQSGGDGIGVKGCTACSKMSTPVVC